MSFANPTTLGFASCMIGLTVLAQSTHADTDPNQQIHGLLLQLADEPSANGRARLAGQVAYSVQTTNDKTRLDSDTIDAISGLLQHQDGSVVFWSAMALGHIGPGAKPYVPALEDALSRELHKEEAYPSKSGIWPSGGVCEALYRINEARHNKCQFP